MKLLNFKFNKDNISIYVDGMYLDLHNLYDFKTIEYDIDKRNVNIYWEKGEGEYVPKDNPYLLKLYAASY